jgi:enoyl-CoA hydratase
MAAAGRPAAVVGSYRRDGRANLAATAAGAQDEMLNDPGNYDRIATLVRETLANLHGMVNCDKPIASAVDGVAMGVGLMIALLSDISVVSEDVRLIDGHIPLGISAGDAAVMIWPLLCGMAKAKYYLLGSEELTGNVAERIGLVSVAVPTADEPDRAVEAAQRMAASPQHALRWTKRSLNHWLRTATPAFEASLAFEASEATLRIASGRASVIARP